MTEDPERLLRELRFRPRESLGAEIAGRARRGEGVQGGPGSRRVLPQAPRWIGVAVALALAAGAISLRAGSTSRIDRCCQDLDGGAGADDGYVVEARGRAIERLTVYEDLDGDGRFSPADRVRFHRGRRPLIGDDSVHTAIRVCCADLDGEGAADDGLLVLHGPGERVVLASLFETGTGRGERVLR